MSQIRVMCDTDGTEGTMWRAVVLFADGTLAVQRYDTGAFARRRSSGQGHESARELSRGETDRVRDLLGVDPDGDLLEAIGLRFISTDELEAFLICHGLVGTVTESEW